MMTTQCHGDPNVDDLEMILSNVKTGLTALQQLQELYDSDLWVIQKPDFAKYRHIAIHISILAGELAKLSEHWEHQVANEGGNESVINVTSEGNILAIWTADLLIHASQLANITNLKLYESLVSRMESNAHKFSPNSRFTDLSVPPLNS